MIMVDASVWIDYFNGRMTPETDYLDSALDREILAIGDIILTEVLQGFREEKDFNHAKPLLTALEVCPLLSTPLAIESARNFHLLRKRGITVRKTIDVIIATWCIEHQIPLLHGERDFHPFTEHLGLRVVV